MPETKGWDKLDRILSKPIKQEFKVLDFHMTDLPKYAKDIMERYLNEGWVIISTIQWEGKAYYTLIKQST